MKHLLLGLILAAILLPCNVLASTPQSKSKTIVYIDGVKYHIHTVKEGETLSAIARVYGVASEKISECNPHIKDGIRAEQTLKIPVIVERRQERMDSKAERRLKRDFVIYEVKQGETLYSISRKYGISVDRILEDNPDIDPLHLEIGTKLLIRKAAIGQTDDEQIEEQIEEYATTLNSVSQEDGYIYYVVQPKDTIYSLSRRFGISQEEFIILNNLQNGLKAGAIVKVPAPKQEGGEVEISEDKGDTITEDSVKVATHSSIDVIFSAVKPGQTLKIAMLLPMSQKGVKNLNMATLYHGFLVGLEELKSRGISSEVMLYNTDRDSTTISNIISKYEFREADLIVGPVYSDEMAQVIEYAERESKPVVSPLAVMPEIESDALFQMAPSEEHKYDKLKPLISEPGTIITLIRTKENDAEFEAEIVRELQSAGLEYTYYDYQSVQGVENAEQSDLTPLLNNDNKHLFFVISNSEVDVDRILASLASAQTNLIARSQSVASFKVIGSTRWNRFQNIDRTTFFKNRVTLFAVFHAKRDNDLVREFDARYIKAFRAFPTLYSYRGYETAMIFVNGMYSDIEYDMEGRRYRPLQTTYNFKQEGGRLTRVNSEWVRIDYNPNFTITIE